jgi:hypothetical protein
MVVMVQWNAVFKRLMTLMDEQGDGYFSGPRFIRLVQEFHPDLLDYTEYCKERGRAGKSTTRRVYFKDILMELDQGLRIKVVNAILTALDRAPGNADSLSEIRKLMGGGVIAPVAVVPAEMWNGDRLNDYLQQIDGAIVTDNYARAVTLSYTCFEGFLGAFVREKSNRDQYPNEILELAKEVREHLRNTIEEYPGEVLNGITQAAIAVDRSRNRFSEAHFANEAGLWLATYVRDW